jgi:two-component sensor histidine kinase
MIFALQIVSSIIKDQISADAKELLLGSTERIKSISNDLLIQYRGDQDTSTEDDSTEVKSAVEDLAATFRTLHKEIEISTEIPAEVILPIPYFSFQRSLTNLLTNSAEALSQTKHAKIQIHAEKNSSQYTMDIIDNGPGVPKEIKDRLFTERATFGKIEGTGIGLYQVRNELADFGGTISLLKSSQGAHFRIVFPADLSRIPMKVSPTIAILESSPDLINFISQTKFDGIEFKTFSRVSDLKKYLSDPKINNLQVTLITDLFLSTQEETSLDLLETYKGFFKIIICTPLVEHKDIQDVANNYGALLTKKSVVKRMSFELAASFKKEL